MTQSAVPAWFRLYQGRRYTWGGGHGTFKLVDPKGYDCSGLVRVCAWWLGVPLAELLPDRTAAGLAAHCTPSGAGPRIAVYGPSKTSIKHVIIELGPGLWANAAGWQPNGGKKDDPTTWHGSVTTRPGPEYRTDLVDVLRFRGRQSVAEASIRALLMQRLED